MIPLRIVAPLLLCAQTFAHPVPESSEWLTYPGGDGPGKGRHIVLIAADQEYRSEQSMPMMAKVLSAHHGFDCTVLFGVNEKGEVDSTMPVYPEKGKESEFKAHHIPGLEHLASTDLVIFFTRLLTLPMNERELIVKYIDSGKPIIALRTANHGFQAPLPYKINGKQVNWGTSDLRPCLWTFAFRLGNSALVSSAGWSDTAIEPARILKALINKANRRKMPAD